MATSNPFSTGRFKINVNRVKSKKWKDADKVDYGGGWGDDDSDDGYDEPAPVSADNPRYPAWNAPPGAYPSNRSFTNPSPPRGRGQSFDQGDERRHFSSAGNFDSPYPTSQRSPFPEPQHDDVPLAQNHGMQHALRLNTQGQGPIPPGGFRPDSRGRQYPPYDDIPMSALGSFPQQRRSDSSNRPPIDGYGRQESPMRPGSRSSNASHRQFPPRKQSLGQAPPPSDFSHASHSPARSQTSGTAVATSTNDDRPPPAFVRPSDIYKRMAEEMEKVRKSQDSSRPSTASEPNRAREGSVGVRSTVPDPKESVSSALPPADDSDSTRRLKPTLDPVPERKSEYGFENLVRAGSSDSAQSEQLKVDNHTLGVSRHGTNASSVYTDRPDPISAGSLSRNVSMSDDLPESAPPPKVRPSYGLPPVGRVSGFGMDVDSADNSALPQPARHAPHNGSWQDQNTGENEDPGAGVLQHRPTMGYTSAVQQAFDQSQHQTPLHHSTTSSTIDRSNSASTADISPIISRKPDPDPSSLVGHKAHPAVLEESSQTDSRPMSSSTLRASETNEPRDVEFSPPAGFRPGYRRDITPPSRDNSPAKKPFQVGLRDVVQPQHGSLLDEGLSTQEQPRGRAQSIKDKPLPAEPKSESNNTNFNAPSPISRTESPPKGTVRGLAGRLESSSERSSPTNPGIQVPLPGLTQGRPPPQTRFESFRPAIPGGWQSYSSTPGPDTPGTGTPGQTGMSPPRARFAQPRTDSTDSIPTASAPKYQLRDEGVAQRAFAAAASAGSALASAFTGHDSGEQDQDSSRQVSEEESENEWGQPSSSSDGIPEPQEPPSPPEEQLTNQNAGHLPSTLLAASIPLPSGTPDQPHQAASTPLSFAESSEADVPQSTLEYFPAPLRTSRSIDPSGVRPPVPNITVPQETANDSENERLQQEIVQSLTPKSSNLDEETPRQGHHFEAKPGALSYRAVTDVGAGTEGNNSFGSSQPKPVGAGHQLSSPPPPTSTQPAVIASTDPSSPQSVTSQSVETGRPGNNDRAMTDEKGAPMPSRAFTAQQGDLPRIDATLTGTSQNQPPAIPESSTATKPFLQQRFSWETGSSPPASVTTPKATSPPSTSSPDTIRAPFQPTGTSTDVTPPRLLNVQPTISKESTPPTQPAQSTATLAITQMQQSNQFSPTSRIRSTSVHNPQPALSQPNEPPAFRTILNLASPAERIKAFEESRQYYATTDDQLHGWLMSMKTAENSELFATNGRVSLDASESTISHKPSPRRILTESAGDGKKLMAAAGRFGGKAGVAAKGFFAKGKEKMRNASSGEKGILAGRRKSTGPPPDQSEDVSTPCRPQDSRSLEGPPQIPLSITPASPLSGPTEWFSNRDFAGSQASGLNSVLQQGVTSSSTAPSDQMPPQLTADHERDTSSGSIAPTAATAIVPAVATSPAISALDSDQEQEEDNIPPSRSISQLTKSPVESPHNASVDRSTSPREPLVTPQGTVAERTHPVARTLAPPPPFIDRHDGPASDVESSDRSLRVPDVQRRSLVSNVSSASPSSGPDAENHGPRRSVSLSPADEVPLASVMSLTKEGRPETEESLPMLSKQVTEQQAPGASDYPSEPTRDAALPPAPASILPRVEESAAQQPLPVSQQVEQQPAQQRVPASQQHDSSEHRPFSFAGIEGTNTFNQVQRMQEQDLSRIPSQPMSPISQTRSSVALSKEMSQVSVDEVPEQANAPAQRHSRSYSRPFGVDPNVRNHPALRTSEPELPPGDRAQMYSSESPLPSARRAQEEAERHRQQQQQREQQPIPPQQAQPYQEGYRIPGPYVQQYRSPKPVSTPMNGRSQAQVQASGKALPSAVRGQGSPQPQSKRTSYIAAEERAPSYQDQSAYKTSPDAYAEYDMKPEEYQVYSQNRPVSQQRQSMGHPPPPPVQQQLSRQQTPTQAPPAPSPNPQPQGERKRSTFGKLFGSSSKGSKLLKQGRPESPNEPSSHPQKEKRGSILRRHESVSSKHSSKYGSQDQLGQLPPSNIQTHSARRQSRDVLNAPTPDNDKPSEAKKKRFSGLGGKLFKSSSNARAATAPTPPTQTGSEHQRTGQRITSPGPYSAQDPRVRSPDPYSAHTPHGQYPAGPGSYFDQGRGQSPQPQSNYIQHQPQHQYPAAASPYQQLPQSGGYAYPSQPSSSQPGPHSSGVYGNPNQNRPSDLRIDTSNQNRNSYNTPATAPAQMQPPRTTSITSPPHNPHPSPGIPTTRGPASPAPRTPQPQSDPRAHVMDLHKRSRSPKLGRSMSDDLTAQQRQTANNTLGTFTSKNISPVGGVLRSQNDQERPFAITVPGLDEEEKKRRKRAQKAATSTTATRSDISTPSSGAVTSIGPRSVVSANTSHLERNVSLLEGYNTPSGPTSPRQARRESARDRGTPGMIAELPGSRAEGYESEEEIPMSATAYPGQEWMPVFVGDGRWDD